LYRSSDRKFRHCEEHLFSSSRKGRRSNPALLAVSGLLRSGIKLQGNFAPGSQ
jgi:hypothetical protein